MGGSLRVSDKIFLGGVTLLCAYLGIGMLFVNFPWGIFGTAFMFIVWSVITRIYTFGFVEDRGIESVTPRYPEKVEFKSQLGLDDPRWVIEPFVPEASETESRVLSAARETISSSRIIMGPTPKGGLVCEPGKRKDSDREDDREFADMMRSL